MESLENVRTMNEALQYLKLQKGKVEGRGSCWHLSVLNQVDGLLDNARSLDLRGREVDFRTRLLLCNTLLVSATKGEALAYSRAGTDALKILDQLLLVPTSGSAGARGFDPTGSAQGSWAGCFCHALLSS